MNPKAKSIGTNRAGGGMPFPFDAMIQFNLPEDPTERVHLTAAAMTAFIHHAIATCDEIGVIAHHLNAPDPHDEPARLSDLWLLLKHTQIRKDDPPNSELLRHPSTLAKRIVDGDIYRATFKGDCDDVAMLGSSIAARMGYKLVELVVIAREGRDWEHVYFRVHANDRWYAMDPQETSKPFEEREHAKRLTFPVWRV